MTFAIHVASTLICIILAKIRLLFGTFHPPFRKSWINNRDSVWRSRLLYRSFPIAIANVASDLFPIPVSKSPLCIAISKESKTFSIAMYPARSRSQFSIVSRFPLGVNYFSTSPVLCPDLPPSLDCNYGISIVASRLPLWCPYCVSDYCKMVFLCWPLANVFAALQLLYRDHECCIVVSSQFTCCGRICCIAIVVSFPIYRDRIFCIAMVIVVSW